MPALCAQGDSIISRGLYFFDKYGFDGDIPARFLSECEYNSTLHTPEPVLHFTINAVRVRNLSSMIQGERKNEKIHLPVFGGGMRNILRRLRGG